jgi:hypothetical protein
MKVKFLYRHRWEEGLDSYDKRKWNKIKLGLWFEKYTINEHKGIILGFYLIVIKFWFVFKP